MIKYMSELPTTRIGIVWIEIPSDMHGRYLCGELKKNMMQTWKTIEDRFVDAFLQDYRDAKVKRICLFDSESAHQPSPSLIRLEIESSAADALIERPAVPIRWMPFQNNLKVEKAMVKSLTSDGFLDGECLAGFERRLCNESRRYLLQHVNEWLDGVADDAAPFLVLYVHWTATIGPVRSSSAQFWGGHTKPFGLALSVRHASVSWCRGSEPVPEKIAISRARTIRCKSEPTASHDYNTTKLTKSAGSIGHVILHNPLYKNEIIDKVSDDINDGAQQ